MFITTQRWHPSTILVSYKAIKCSQDSSKRVSKSNRRSLVSTPCRITKTSRTICIHFIMVKSGNWKVISIRRLKSLQASRTLKQNHWCKQCLATPRPNSEAGTRDSPMLKVSMSWNRLKDQLTVRRQPQSTIHTLTVTSKRKQLIIRQQRLMDNLAQDKTHGVYLTKAPLLQLCGSIKTLASPLERPAPSIGTSSWPKHPTMTWRQPWEISSKRRLSVLNNKLIT